MDIYRPDNRPDQVYVVHGWIGVCGVCRQGVVTNYGYAVYCSISGRLKTYAPHKTWCPNDPCRAVVKPHPMWSAQETAIAAYALGGWAAVIALLPQGAVQTF